MQVPFCYAVIIFLPIIAYIGKGEKGEHGGAAERDACFLSKGLKSSGRGLFFVFGSWKNCGGTNEKRGCEKMIYIFSQPRSLYSRGLITALK